MKDHQDWEKVGVVGVDAGLIWLSDPCYIIHNEEKNEDLGENWGEFCDKLLVADAKDGTRQWHTNMGHPGLGVTVSSGWGDGVYDVKVQRNSYGRIMRVMIDFDDQEEEDSFWDEDDEAQDYFEGDYDEADDPYYMRSNPQNTLAEEDCS